MSDKSLGVIINSAPYSSSQFKEALDLVLAACTFDRKVDFLLQGDACYALLNNQNPSHINQKNLSHMLKALPIYGLDEVLVCYNSLASRALLNCDYCVPVKTLNNTEVATLIKTVDTIIRF